MRFLNTHFFAVLYWKFSIIMFDFRRDWICFTKYFLMESASSDDTGHLILLQYLNARLQLVDDHKYIDLGFWNLQIVDLARHPD